jgi:hypothetical protein
MLQKYDAFAQSRIGTPAPQRVWFELERPPIELPSEERDKIADDRAAKLSKVIERLSGQKDYCFWLPKEGHYAFGGHMGFVEATDDGHWFNLDFFANPE